MNRERDLAQKVLVFDEEGNHIGRRLDTAAKGKQAPLLGDCPWLYSKINNKN